MARQKIHDTEAAIIDQMLLLCASLSSAAGLRASAYVHMRQQERVAEAAQHENDEHQEAVWPPQRLKSTSD